MSFYGKVTEADKPEAKRRFGYTTTPSGDAVFVRAHDVYFYESGHVGFWADLEDGKRELVVAVKALDVWEDNE